MADGINIRKAYDKLSTVDPAYMHTPFPQLVYAIMHRNEIGKKLNKTGMVSCIMYMITQRFHKTTALDLQIA